MPISISISIPTPMSIYLKMIFKPQATPEPSQNLQYINPI